LRSLIGVRFVADHHETYGSLTSIALEGLSRGHGLPNAQSAARKAKCITVLCVDRFI